MNDFSDFLRRGSVWGVGLLLAALGAVFAFSLFLAVLLVAAFGIIGALLSGRKPAPLVLWSRWREMRTRSPFAATRERAGFARSAGAARERAAEAVVDVEAREVMHDDTARDRQPNSR